jgi:hypothetical protein
MRKISSVRAVLRGLAIAVEVDRCPDQGDGGEEEERHGGAW